MPIRLEEATRTEDTLTQATHELVPYDALLPARRARALAVFGAHERVDLQLHNTDKRACGYTT